MDIFFCTFGLQKKKMVRLIITLLFLVATFLNCKGQDTARLDKPLEFDKPLIIKYKFPSNEKIQNVYLFGKGKDGCLVGIEECTNRFRSKLDSNNNIGLLLKSSRDSNNLYFEVPALQPNKNYVVLISQSFRPSGFDEFIKNLNNQNNEDSLSYSLADSLMYEKIYQDNLSVNEFGDQCKNCDDTFGILSFLSFWDLDTSELNGQYKNIEIAKSKIRRSSELDSSLCHQWDIQAFPKELKSLIEFSENCIECKDTFFQYQSLNRNTKNPFSSINAMLHSHNKDILLGLVSLDSLSISYTTATSLNDRINNLGKSIVSLQHLLNITEYFSAKFPQRKLNNTDKMLESLLSCLQQNKLIISSALKSENALKSTITKSQNLIDSLLGNFFRLPTRAVNTNTFTYKFETRTGFALLPDFGFMAFYDPSLGTNNLSLRNNLGFSPYLGFHVNFRPYNTDIPFNTIKKKFFEHLSFNAGVLVGSLSQEGVRTGIIGKTFIFSGLGYCFGHAVRLTGGFIFYRTENDNPLIDRKSLAATPFLGVSMDIRLKGIYDTLKGLF